MCFQIMHIMVKFQIFISIFTMVKLQKKTPQIHQIQKNTCLLIVSSSIGLSNLPCFSLMSMLDMIALDYSSYVEL